MRVGVIGINYKTSSLDLREVLAKACRFCFSPERFSFKMPGTVLLSTCNRTEIYFGADDLTEAHGMILAELREYIHEPFEQKLYSFFGADCFWHLAQVAAGLDSAILSETEIQQQVKQAYQAACTRGGLSCCLHFLFQKSLKISKEVRAAFPLPRGLPSLEKVLFQIVHKGQANRKFKTLFIGNSQINRQILPLFRAKRDSSLTLCTRSPEKAKALFDNDVELVDWSILPHWPLWDVIICATQHQEYLLHEEQTQEFPFRESRLVFDLSVPRNVDPRLSNHPYLYLFNMEQLAQMVDTQRRRHLGEVDAAIGLVVKGVERQLEIYQEKLTRRLICTG